MKNEKIILSKGVKITLVIALIALCTSLGVLVTYQSLYPKTIIAKQLTNYNTPDKWPSIYIHKTIDFLLPMIYQLRVAEQLGMPRNIEYMEEARKTLYSLRQDITKDTLLAGDSEILAEFMKGYDMFISALSAGANPEYDESMISVENMYVGAVSYFDYTKSLIGVDYLSAEQYLPESYLTGTAEEIEKYFMQILFDLNSELSAVISTWEQNNQQSHLIALSTFNVRYQYEMIKLDLAWNVKDEELLKKKADIFSQFRDRQFILNELITTSNTWITEEDFDSYYLYEIVALSGTNDFIANAYGITKSPDVISNLLDGVYFRDNFGVWRKGESKKLYAKSDSGEFYELSMSDIEEYKGVLYYKSEDGSYTEAVSNNLIEYNPNSKNTSAIEIEAANHEGEPHYYPAHVHYKGGIYFCLQPYKNLDITSEDYDVMWFDYSGIKFYQKSDSTLYIQSSDLPVEVLGFMWEDDNILFYSGDNWNKISNYESKMNELKAGDFVQTIGEDGTTCYMFKEHENDNVIVYAVNENYTAFEEVKR